MVSFYKKISVFLFIAGICLCSCNEQAEKSVYADTKEVLRADMQFSDMCRQIGMRKAFTQYMDNEGTLLRPDHLPIVGAEAINYISMLNDTSYILSWKPLHADIAVSGDLGYTYGVYELTLPDTTFKGTYVNIWKKEKDGEWKFVLNSDNPGLGNADE